MNTAIHATHTKRQPTLNTDVAHAQIQRRANRAEDTNSAREIAAQRKREQLAAASPANRTRELIDATRPMATRNSPADTRGVQTTATAPDAPVVHAVTYSARTWPAVTLTILITVFIAGLALGSSL